MESPAGQTKSGMHGRLRVSIPASSGMRYFAPMLRRFVERYPELKVDICSSDLFVVFVENGFNVASAPPIYPD